MMQCLHIFHKWFPMKEKHTYPTRHEEKYKEYKCKTERGRANPLCYYRRTLNKREAAPVGGNDDNNNG